MEDLDRDKLLTMSFIICTGWKIAKEMSEDVPFRDGTAIMAGLVISLISTASTKCIYPPTIPETNFNPYSSYSKKVCRVRYKP